MADIKKNMEATLDVLEKIKKLEEELVGTGGKRFNLELKIAASKKATQKEQKAINDLLKEEDKLNADILESQKEMEKSLTDVGNQYDNVASGAGHLKNMLKAGPKDLRASAKAAGAWAGKMSDIGNRFGQMPGAMGKAAKAAGLLGGAVGGIATKLAGVPGLILMALKALGDAAVKYDNWIKGLNKNFAMVRGPDLFTSDVANQMKDFNSALFSVHDNIRDGLDNKEVLQFIDSMYQAGTAVSKINTGLFSYRDTVHIAAKASAVFGMDLSQTGALMSKMVTDMKYSLGDVDKAFVQVAFDAQRSGLSTDRFWQSVENATASLSLYGKFVKGFANTLANAQKSQTAGAAETLDAVQNLTRAFSTMDVSAAAGFMKIAQRGGAEFDKMFKNLQDESAAALKDLQDTKRVQLVQKLEIATKKGDQDAINKLNAEIKDLDVTIGNTKGERDDLGILVNLVKAGDFTKVGPMLAKLSDKSPVLLMKLLKGVNGTSDGMLNFTKLSYGTGQDYLIALEAIKNLMPNLSADNQKFFLKQFMNASNLQQKAIGIGSQGNDNQKSFISNLKSMDGNLKGGSIVKALESLNEKSSPEALETASATLQDMLKMEKGDADELVKTAAASAEMNKSFQNFVNLAVKGNKRTEAEQKEFANMNSSLLETAKGIDLNNKIFEYDASHNLTSSLDTQAAYDDTFDQIKNNTLTFEKMKEIVKDGVSWQLGSWELLRSLDTWVTKIGRRYLSKTGGGGKEQEAAKKALKAQNIDFSNPEKTVAEYRGYLDEQQKLLASGNLTPEKEKEVTKNIIDYQQVIDNVQAAADDFSMNFSNFLKKTADERSEMFRTTPTETGTYVQQTFANGKPNYGPSIPLRGSLPGAPGTTTPTTDVPLKQGLMSPEKVTTAGAVVLHPNETILPASFGNFQTKPWMMEAAAPTAAAGGAAPNVNIQINASDFVLAGKLEKAVRNTVRSVLYNEQVNGLG